MVTHVCPEGLSTPISYPHIGSKVTRMGLKSGAVVKCQKVVSKHSLKKGAAPLYTLYSDLSSLNQVGGRRMW